MIDFESKESPTQVRGRLCGPLWFYRVAGDANELRALGGEASGPSSAIFPGRHGKLGISSRSREITGRGIVRNSSGPGEGRREWYIPDVVPIFGTILAVALVTIRSPAADFYRVAEI